MATALRLAEERRADYTSHCVALRERLLAGIRERVPDAYLNGHPTQRLPNNANVAFDAVEGESVLLLLDQHGVAASSGSACTSGALEASHVLLALGLPHDRAIGTVRFTLGKDTTQDEIDYLLDVLPPLIEQLRAVAVAYR
jgi:cysteine desulfurase